MLYCRNIISVAIFIMLLISPLSLFLAIENTKASGISPSISNPSPSNSSTDQSLNPPLSITVSDPEGDELNITFRSNATSEITRTWYFDNYSFTNWSNHVSYPYSHLVDNNNDTCVITLGVHQKVFILDNNTCNVSDLGTITKVELVARVSGTSEQGDWIIYRLVPIFNGTNGDQYNSTWNYGTGITWISCDITNDSSSPDNWTWSDISNLDCEFWDWEHHVVNKMSGKGFRVGIRVTYSWALLGSNITVTNGTYIQIPTDMNSYNTTYYWLVNVFDGSSWTNETYHFTTEIDIPEVITNDPTGVEENNATLQGYLQRDGGESCTVRFEYGITPNYGINTSNQTKTAGDTFSDNISGLTLGQLYHYRTYANSTLYDDLGEDKIFLTKSQEPINLTAQANSSSIIYLSWTKGAGSNNTYIERHTSSSWERRVGTEIYNGTGTNYEDTGLTNGTSYYYQAWSYANWTYNATTFEQWSDANISATNRTDILPTITNEEPSNGSTGVTTTPLMNISVNDSDGDTMTITWYSNSSGSWQIFGTNESIGNGTYSQTNSNFSSNSTKYWWNISVDDGRDTNNSGIFHFTTQYGLPIVITNISTGIEEINATLNGYLQGNNSDNYSVWFNYGTDIEYGNSTTQENISVGETYNYNLGATATLYEFYTGGDTEGIQIYGDWCSGQTFTVGAVGENQNHYLKRVSLKIRKVGSPDTFFVGVKATSGGLPTGNYLIQVTVDPSEIGSMNWYDIDFTTSYQLTAGTKYALILTCPEGNSGNHISWAYNSLSASYSGGNRVWSITGGSSWSNDNTVDLSFKEFELIHLTPGTLYHHRAVVNYTNDLGYGINRQLLTKPEAPSGFTAETNSSTIIYLNWTKGLGANNTYIERYNSQNWERGIGTQVYNGTNSYYEDTGLTNSTSYYYQAWSYAIWTYNGTTIDQWSDANVSITNMTYNNPTITYVDDDFNASTPGWSYDKFSNIQEGISAVKIFGTVYVYNGTYHEDNILFGSESQDKTGCTLLAESQNAIIDSNYSDTTIFIYANDSILDGFTITEGDDAGIWVNADNVTIKNCSITGCNRGIYSIDGFGYDATNLAVENNSIQNNIFEGIYFNDNSHDIDIFYNNISDNGNNGISTLGTPYNILISDNSFFRNEGEGAIWIAEESNSITICENNFTESDQYAIFISGEAPCDISIYLNNFINNADGVFDEVSNTWDNGTLGNYYNEYDQSSEGAWDNNTDGIIDDPYVIDGDSQDNYPLMNPWNGLPLEHAPNVTTNESLGICETNATLCGYLNNDGNDNCTVRFEYGTTINYGNISSNQTKLTGQTFTANILNLTRGQLYHFRTYAINSFGSSTGNDNFFLTKPAIITSSSATASSSSRINLAWTKGNGANNTYIVRKTGSYPSSRSDGTLIYNSTGTSYSDTGLSASTTYYYRAWSFTVWDSQNQWSDSYDSITSTTNAGGGGGSPSPPPPSPPDEDEDEEDEDDANIVKETVENLFNINLNENFYATDTNGDGTVDTFNDPNNILISKHFISINGNSSFLLSVNNDIDQLFIWDTKSNNIHQVSHSIGKIKSKKIDTVNDTAIIIVKIKKSGWVYFEITDEYQDYSDFNVIASDGRIILKDMTWRQDNKIFVLDDPSVEYTFIFAGGSISPDFLFDVILELTPSAVSSGESVDALITLINVGESGLVIARINYTLLLGNEIIWSEEEDISIQGQKAFVKQISTDDLNSGEYTFRVVHYYGDGQTATAEGRFTIKALSEELSYWIYVLIGLLIAGVILFLFWYKRRSINLKESYYFETEEDERKDHGTDNIHEEIDRLIMEREEESQEKY